MRREEFAKKEVELERLRLVIRDNVLTPEVRANGYGAIDQARMEEAIGQIALAYTFKARPKVEAVFDPSFLPPAANAGRTDGLLAPGGPQRRDLGPSFPVRRLRLRAQIRLKVVGKLLDRFAVAAVTHVDSAIDLRQRPAAARPPRYRDCCARRARAASP